MGCHTYRCPPDRWRAGTLDYFDGAQWRDTTDPALGYGEEISPEIETQIVPQYFEVMNSEMRRVFGAYKIVQPSLDPNGVQQNSDGSWSVDRPLTEGSGYRVISEIPQPSEAQLQAAGDVYPDEIENNYLQLPEDRPQVIAQTAAKIRQDYDPRTPYGTARAIEQYLVYDGNFTYNLDVSYRRADEAIVGLEEAVRRMTSAPAARLGLSNRGLVRDGFVADLVVFDPTRVRSTATYEEPRSYPDGIDWVLVGGEPVVADGRHTGARPGRTLRRR